MFTPSPHRIPAEKSFAQFWQSPEIGAARHRAEYMCVESREWIDELRYRNKRVNKYQSPATVFKNIHVSIYVYTHI